jgi:uncharacterized protein (DUF1697 family)
MAMAELRVMLESLGYTDVRTQGQSGNALFATPERTDAALEQEISVCIKRTFGMEVAVLVRTAAEFATAVTKNPFVARRVPATELHVCFLSATPTAAKVKAINPEDFTPDEFVFGDRLVYLRLPNGVMGSTLPDWDRVLGVRATQRNWNTTTKLRDLIA